MSRHTIHIEISTYYPLGVGRVEGGEDIIKFYFLSKLFCVKFYIVHRVNLQIQETEYYFVNWSIYLKHCISGAIRTQEKEIEELKSKIAQVLAVMPNDTFGSPTSTNNISRVRLAESPPSNLDPNATAYTPKSSLVASTEA